MQLLVEFGQMKKMNPADEQVQLQVRKLPDYIIDVRVPDTFIVPASVLLVS